jgi:hypothetical protein
LSLVRRLWLMASLCLRLFGFCHTASQFAVV